MARVEGFEPAKSEQKPVDVNGNPVPVGVFGDSSTGVGVFGTSGTLPPNVSNIPTNIAGVEGHSIENPGVAGLSIQSQGVFGRSETSNGILGVTFAPSIPDQAPNAGVLRPSGSHLNHAQDFPIEKAWAFRHMSRDF